MNVKFPFTADVCITELVHSTYLLLISICTLGKQAVINFFHYFYNLLLD